MDKDPAPAAYDFPALAVARNVFPIYVAKQIPL